MDAFVCSKINIYIKQSSEKQSSNQLIISISSHVQSLVTQFYHNIASQLCIHLNFPIIRILWGLTFTKAPTSVMNTPLSCCLFIEIIPTDENIKSARAYMLTYI